MWWMIVAGVILLIAVIIGFIIATIPSTQQSSTGSTVSSSSSPPEQLPEYTPPANFHVFNYLPNHSLRVEVLNPDSGKSVVLVDGVQPLKTKGITKDKVEAHLHQGNIIRIYITDSEGVCKHYTDHVIDNACDQRIKNLHVGMITTRFIGKSTDGLRMSTLADNAIQGHSWLLIHNLTELPIRLNDDIVVAPHSTERYLGYLHQGVTLGMIFKDQDNIYPDFQYLNPHTDLYYGVVSDLRQPLYGPFQFEYSDDCDLDQTLWPFELGQM